MHAFPKHRSFLSIAHAALMFLGTCAPAHATGTLSFTGGGYWIDLEIGEGRGGAGGRGPIPRSG
jgi:hypothetical protein